MDTEYIKKQKKLTTQLENNFSNGGQKTTIVDIQSEYSSNDQITLTSVTFLPKNIVDQIIENVIEPLKSIEPDFFYFSHENMHMTVKNIRTISNPPKFNDNDIEKAKKVFSEIVPRFKKINLWIEDVLLFPTSISLMAYSDDDFPSLIKALDKGLNDIGVPDNKKYLSNDIYWGNITICRFTHQPSLKFIQEVKKFRNLKIGEFKLEKVKLITANVVFNFATRKIIDEYDLTD